MNNPWTKRNRFPRVPKKLIILFIILFLIGLVEIAAIWWQLGKINKEEANGLNSSSSEVNKQEVTSFDKTKYSIDEADSLWAVVNKGRKLPSGYVPDNLEAPNVKLRYGAANAEMRMRADAVQALEALFAAAANEKIYLRLSSGYRSYSTQSVINAREIRTYGQAQADRQSARAGHSEHQTGLAVDVAPSDGRCEITDCFADTPEGKWAAANSFKYGYIIRYPDGKENLTGYKFEPWHLRYVGEELAAELNETGQTLEQFFDQPHFPSYPSSIFQLK